VKQTGMPPRSGWMRPCGKPYESEEAARMSKRGQQAGARPERCRDRACGMWHVKAQPGSSAPGLVTPRRETGFSYRVRLQVRTRAGNGEIEQASCESCGIWLGRYLGQVHHRLGRQAGGCKLAVVGCSANGLLLCGDPFTGCHGLATAFDERMLHAAFVLEHGNDPMVHDPRYVSVMWHALAGSGVTLWLGANGETDYLLACPVVTA
jgi:hypothetical protein